MSHTSIPAAIGGACQILDLRTAAEVCYQQSTATDIYCAGTQSRRKGFSIYCARHAPPSSLCEAAYAKADLPRAHYQPSCLCAAGAEDVCCPAGSPQLR